MGGAGHRRNGPVSLSEYKGGSNLLSLGPPQLQILSLVAILLIANSAEFINRLAQISVLELLRGSQDFSLPLSPPESLLSSIPSPPPSLPSHTPPLSPTPASDGRQSPDLPWEKHSFEALNGGTLYMPDSDEDQNEEEGYQSDNARDALLRPDGDPLLSSTSTIFAARDQQGMPPLEVGNESRPLSTLTDQLVSLSLEEELDQSGAEHPPTHGGDLIAEGNHWSSHYSPNGGATVVHYTENGTPVTYTSDNISPTYNEAFYPHLDTSSSGHVEVYNPCYREADASYPSDVGNLGVAVAACMATLNGPEHLQDISSQHPTATNLPLDENVSIHSQHNAEQAYAAQHYYTHYPESDGESNRLSDGVYPHEHTSHKFAYRDDRHLTSPPPPAPHVHFIPSSYSSLNHTYAMPHSSEMTVVPSASAQRESRSSEIAENARYMRSTTLQGACSADQSSCGDDDDEEDGSFCESDEIISSRDEKRARALQIPIPTLEIVNLPIDEFNERLTKYELTDTQLSLIRDIRRRGKNKVAAQNCRKRKLDQINTLQLEVDSLLSQRRALQAERHGLLSARELAQQRYSKLYRLISDIPTSNPLRELSVIQSTSGGQTTAISTSSVSITIPPSNNNNSVISSSRDS